jgi:hypothetical protein
MHYIFEDKHGEQREDFFFLALAPRSVEKHGIEWCLTRFLENNPQHKEKRFDTLAPSLIPNDRFFEKTRRFDFDKKEFLNDMSHAKYIFLSKIRDVRNEELSKSDIELTRAVESGDDLTTIKEKRQALRDLPENVNLEAKDLTELRSKWPAIIERRTKKESHGLPKRKEDLENV